MQSPAISDSDMCSKSGNHGINNPIFIVLTPNEEDEFTNFAHYCPATVLLWCKTENKEGKIIDI